MFTCKEQRAREAASEPPSVSGASERGETAGPDQQVLCPRGGGWRPGEPIEHLHGDKSMWRTSPSPRQAPVSSGGGREVAVGGCTHTGKAFLLHFLSFLSNEGPSSTYISSEERGS